jgi:hypothetical protein
MKKDNKAKDIWLKSQKRDKKGDGSNFFEWSILELEDLKVYLLDMIAKMEEEKDGSALSILEGSEAGQLTDPHDSQFWIDDNLTTKLGRGSRMRYRPLFYSGAFALAFNSVVSKSTSEQYHG